MWICPSIAALLSSLSCIGRRSWPLLSSWPMMPSNRTWPIFPASTASGSCPLQALEWVCSSGVVNSFSRLDVVTISLKMRLSDPGIANSWIRNPGSLCFASITMTPVIVGPTVRPVRGIYSSAMEWVACPVCWTAKMLSPLQENCCPSRGENFRPKLCERIRISGLPRVPAARMTWPARTASGECRRRSDSVVNTTDSSHGPAFSARFRLVTLAPV